MDSLVISATAHGLNYLPEYFAEHTGLFAERNLDVTALARDPWTGVLEDLTSGAADIGLGGLWVPMMYAGMSRRLSVVAQLNHQFPMAILARNAPTDFDLSWLKGKTVLAPGAGGSAPYEFTAGLIREAGLDPAATRFVRDLSTDMLVELFEGGLGDAIIADLATAGGLQDRGFGTIVFRHLDSGGIMPNSVYYCRADRVDELSDKLDRFVDAIATAMDQLPTAAPSVIDDIISKHWPAANKQVFTTAAQSMLASHVWDTVVIDPTASDRWARILAEGGLVTAAPSYPSLVDGRFMDAHK